MTKLIMKKQMSVSPLKALLLSKGYTLPDLKCEVSLIFCNVLFEIFLLSKKEGKSYTLLEGSTDEENYIFNKIEQLSASIKKSVVGVDFITREQKKGETSAKITLPYKILYNEIVGAYHSKKSYYVNEYSDGKKYWMPELLAIHIIGHMKELGYSYNKFPFIKDDDFVVLIDKYIKTNQSLQQIHNLKIRSKKIEELSIISKTRHFAQYITTKIVQSKIK